MLVGLNDKHAAALAEGDAVAVVKGRAAVCRQSVQREKARVGNGCKRIGAARNGDIALAASYKVAGIGNADGARSAGVRNIRNNAAGTELVCDLVCDGGYGHTENIVRVAAVSVVILNACRTAHAAAHNNAHAGALFCGDRVAGIAESFFCRL